MDLYDLLFKIQEEWHIFSDTGQCPIDFTSEEHEIYRARHKEWTQCVALNNDIANAVGGLGDGWIHDKGFEDAKRRFDELHRL